MLALDEMIDGGMIIECDPQQVGAHYFILTIVLFCPFLCNSFSVLIRLFLRWFQEWLWGLMTFLWENKLWHRLGMTQRLCFPSYSFLLETQGNCTKKYSRSTHWLQCNFDLFQVLQSAKEQLKWSLLKWSKSSWCAFTYRLFEPCPPIVHIDLVVVVH